MNLADLSGVLPLLAAHAQIANPRECCGLVVRPKGTADLVYCPCSNIAAGPAGEDRFVLDPAGYAAAEDLGEVLAICHSHPNADANPSEADRVMCEASGLPWVIMGWPSQVVRLVEPSGYQAPLENRTFHHGVLDCYTLMRDYYQRECGIVLPDYERQDGWWETGQTLYRDHFADAGFVQVQGVPRRHDAFLMKVAARVENHAAAYLGDGIILHHLYGRPSCKDVYGGAWVRCTTALLRHKSLLGAQP